MTKKEKKSLIPDFGSYEEEAHFWDTHDTTDFEDEMKPVQVRFAKNLSAGINIRFDPKTLAGVRHIAHEKGVGPTTLIRMWVLEQLKEEQGYLETTKRD